MDEFWKAYLDQTDPNPFHRSERVWRARVRFALKRHADVVEIRLILSLFRHEGNGTAALDWLVDLARRHQVTLTGEIQSAGRAPLLTPRELASWYRRHGFTVTITTPHLICLNPRTSR